MTSVSGWMVAGSAVGAVALRAFGADTPSADPATFDLAGLKIGMPLAEARAAVKARKLAKYIEAKGKLTYLGDTGAMQDVPNGGFASAISSYSQYGLPDSDSIYVSLTPEPAHERVALAVRTVYFSQPNYIL